jgi:hypothetical protein
MSSESPWKSFTLHCAASARCAPISCSWNYRPGGEDIEQHLPFILAMMEAPDTAIRQRGLAALYSAFPDLAKELHDYRLHGSAEARHLAVERLRKPA